MDLTECPGCRRHVRASDASCPFCRGAVVPRVRSIARGRLSRFAILTGLAIATCSGCGDETSDGDAGYDAGLVVTPYGTPAFAAYV